MEAITTEAERRELSRRSAVAFAAMQEDAARKGIHMTLDEINEEIDAARRHMAERADTARTA